MTTSAQTTQLYQLPRRCERSQSRTAEPVLRVDGVLDRRSVELVRAQLQDALDRTAAGHDLVVDISGVTHVDSCGLGVLVAAHARANRQGSRLVLRAPRPALVRLLAVTRLGHVLHLAR